MLDISKTMVSAAALAHIVHGNPGNCKLEEITLGWGFSSYLSLEALQPAIMSLRSITVGLGGSLGEDALKRLPAACPMLETVILHFQVISDTVIINILAYLRNLRSFHCWDVSFSIQECREVTANGVSSLLDCAAIEDLLLHHNGPGIQKTFTFYAASKLPMLRKISLECLQTKVSD
ncbi:hypothetical protein CMV_023460 [Castanea mollissima]|uniref:Uncharacterized protein n=1 Tax=Castanea mollissima TaxID=60419 RepID=A0A8J4QC52_9ROSI|nr:hypothetical protein CMV_023460 [Castanea mollissima]